LDVGCAEGSITSALGAALNLREENIHGCDVRDVPPIGAKFSFKTIEADGSLPYQDRSFDFVTLLMVLHHVSDAEFLLKEIKRVLKPNGILLLREHDCDSELLAKVIDVMHGLYTRVWSDPAEMGTFCGFYMAGYRPKSVWRKMLMQAGFSAFDSSPDRSDKPMLYSSNNYFGVYYSSNNNTNNNNNNNSNDANIKVNKHRVNKLKK